MKCDKGRYQIIKMSNLYQGNFDLNRNPSFIDEIEPRHKQYLLQEGDVLMTLTGTIGKKDYGFSVQILKQKNLLLNQRVCLLRPKAEKVNGYYLLQLLRSKNFLAQFFESSIGGTGNQSNVSITLLKDMVVELPEIETQTAIADMLLTWDQSIEKTERLIAAKEIRLFALYQKCFQPGTSINAYWKLKKLSTYLISRNEKAIPTEDVPLYSLTIENGVTAKTDRYNRDFLVKDTDSKAYKVVCPGDIVFNPANLRWGAIARSAVEHKVVISPIYEVLEIRKDIVDPELLSHAITCPRQIGIYATKTEGTLIERMAVKLDVFLLIEILLPESLDAQRKIGMLLRAAREEIDLLKKQLESYRQQKRGLMQKLLTGQWRVKINPEVVK